MQAVWASCMGRLMHPPWILNFLECLLDIVSGFRLKEIQLYFFNLIVPWFLDESGTLGEVDVLHG